MLAFPLLDKPGVEPGLSCANIVVVRIRTLLQNRCRGGCRLKCVAGVLLLFFSEHGTSQITRSKTCSRSYCPEDTVALRPTFSLCVMTVSVVCVVKWTSTCSNITLSMLYHRRIATDFPSPHRWVWKSHQRMFALYVNSAKLAGGYTSRLFLLCPVTTAVAVFKPTVAF